jgi:hypothetical protein
MGVCGGGGGGVGYSRWVKLASTGWNEQFSRRSWAFLGMESFTVSVSVSGERLI